ncbi:hypothetical protein ACFX13_035385 [Malus domestica]
MKRQRFLEENSLYRLESNAEDPFLGGVGQRHDLGTRLFVPEKHSVGVAVSDELFGDLLETELLRNVILHTRNRKL